MSARERGTASPVAVPSGTGVQPVAVGVEQDEGWNPAQPARLGHHEGQPQPATLGHHESQPQPATLGPSHGEVTGQGVWQVYDARRPLRLDCGRTLDSVRVAFETFGTPNADRSNAVLVCHALSGDSHALRRSERDRPGWWESLIGPGRAIDTDRWWVIASNVLGGCAGTTGPLSVDPQTGRRYGPTFPYVTVADMVRVQRALLDRLGVPRLALVIGGSLGGMQALEWAVRFPGFAERAAVLASSARLDAQGIGWNAIGRAAILADPAFRDGWYEPGEPPAAGLAIARSVAHVTYLSPASLERRFGRGLRRGEGPEYDARPQFNIETYLEHKGRRFLDRFDANAYLRITRAMDYFDLSRHGGSDRAAFARSRSRFLFVGFEDDWLFPPACSAGLAEAALGEGLGVTHATLPGGEGHDSFLLPNAGLSALVGDFLNASP